MQIKSDIVMSPAKLGQYIVPETTRGKDKGKATNDGIEPVQLVTNSSDNARRENFLNKVQVTAGWRKMTELSLVNLTDHGSTVLLTSAKSCNQISQ